MATKLRGVPVSAANGPLDRRLHDIGWGLVAKPLLTKTA